MIAPLIVAAVLGLEAFGNDHTASGSASSAAAHFPLTITNCGRKVTFKKRPKRVLTIGPEAPTLLAAAGAANKIVARNFEFGSPLGQYAKQLKKVKQLSPDKELSKEEILAQNPDLVMEAALSIPIPDLNTAGINVIVTPGRCKPRTSQSFPGIFSAIKLYGRLFGTEKAANTAVTGLHKRVRAVQNRFKKKSAGKTAAALIFSTAGPVGSYGKLGTVHNQIGALGLRNVFADQRKAFFEVNSEALLKRYPDVLILLSQKRGETKAQIKSKLLSRPELRELKAIKNNRIIVLFYSETAGSPVAVEGLETMAKQLAVFLR